MPLTNAEVDSAVPAAGIPNRALTNAALKELIADVAAAAITDLGATGAATSVTITNSAGSDAVIQEAGLTAGVMSATDKSKLNGIATGATANATDAQLRDRSTHTGTQAAATISDFSAAADARVAAAAATGTGNLVRVNAPALAGATATADPSAALGLATKQYVDGIAANLGKRQRVRVATTANITISTALNNGDTLDGVTLVTGDYVLVKDQSTTNQNGVYEVGASPARVAEFDTYDEHPGSLIAVQEGTTNADTLWLCTSNVGGTLNTTAITFSAFSAATVAASVSVSDAGGYYAGANVEAVLQEVGADIEAKADAFAPVTLTGATNLVRGTHGNRLIILNSGSAFNVTIEDDTTGAWQAGDFLQFVNIGAGTVTIQGDGTATVTAESGFALTIPTNCIAAAVRNGTNAWTAKAQLSGSFSTLVASATTSLLLGTAGSAVGNIGFRNATSGTATLAPPTGALGTYSVTLPNAASTLPIFGQQVTFTGPTAARSYALPDEAADIGFRGIPINSQSADYTAVLADAGKCLYHPSADTTPRTFTIPANGSVAYPVGTTLMFDNDDGAGALTIAITTDTLVLVGTAGSTGSRTLAEGGRATAVKVTSTRWRISGSAELT